MKDYLNVIQYNCYHYIDKCYNWLTIFFPDLSPCKKLSNTKSFIKRNILFGNLHNVYFSNCLLFEDTSCTPRDLMHAGLVNPYGIPVAQLYSPCMPSDPFTLRLFVVPPAWTVWKTTSAAGLQEKSDGFGKMAEPVRKFNNGEEIIRPEIRGDVVASLARAGGPVDVCPEKFTARARRRCRCNEEAKSKINIRKV